MGAFEGVSDAGLSHSGTLWLCRVRMVNNKAAYGSQESLDVCTVVKPSVFALPGVGHDPFTQKPKYHSTRHKYEQILCVYQKRKSNVLGHCSCTMTLFSVHVNVPRGEPSIRHSRSFCLRIGHAAMFERLPVCWKEEIVRSKIPSV